MEDGVAVAGKERTCRAEVEFSYRVEFPASFGQFVAVADCCLEGSRSHLAKEEKAHSFKVGEDYVVFHNYPDSVVLRKFLEENQHLLDVLDTLPVRFNNLDDLQDSLEKMSLIIDTWFFFHPRDNQGEPGWEQSSERNAQGARSFSRATTVRHDALAKQQF